MTAADGQASPRRPASMFIASNEREWTGEGILAKSSGAQPRSRLTSSGSAATIRFADLEEEAKQQISTTASTTPQDEGFEQILNEGSSVPHLSTTSSSSSQHSRLWLSNPVEKAQQCPTPSPRAAAAATSNVNYADELRLWQANREHRRTRSEAASISPLPPSEVGHASGVLVSSSLGGKPQHHKERENCQASESSSPSVLPPRPSHPSPPPFPRRMVSVTSTNEASDRTVRPEFSQQGLQAQLLEVKRAQHRRQTSGEDNAIISRSNSSLEEVISARVIDSLGQRERNISLTPTNGELSAAQGSSVLISSIYNDTQPPLVQARQSLPAEYVPRARDGSIHSVAHSSNVVGARDSFQTAITTPTADRWARAASSVPSPPPLPPRRVSSHTPSSSTDHSRSAKVRASKDLSSAQARQNLTAHEAAHDVQSGEGHGRPLSGTATSLAFQTATEHNGTGQSGGDCGKKSNSRDYTQRLPGYFEAEMREERAHFAQETQPQPVLPQAHTLPAVRAPIRGPRKQPPPPPSPAPQRVELPTLHPPARPSRLREASAATGSASETSSFASIKYWRQVVAVEAFLGSTERVSKTQASSSRNEGARAPQQQQQRSRHVSGTTTGGSSPTTTAGTVSSRRRLSDREAAKLFGRLAPCNVEEQRAAGRGPSTQQEPRLLVGGMVAAAGGIAQPSEDKRASMPSTTDTFGVAAAAARSGSLHNRITEVIEEGRAFSREDGAHDWQQNALPSLLRRSASSPDMALLCSDFTPLEERGARGSLDRYAPIPSNSSHVATTSAVTATATAEDDDDDDGALLVISLIAQRVGLAGQALLSLGHDLAEYQRQATATTTPTAGGGASTSTRGARRRRDGGPAV